MKLRRLATIGGLAVLVAACGSTSLAPPPAPLPSVANKLIITEVWRRSFDDAEGSRLQPAWQDDLIAVISGEKQLSLLDANTGKTRWKTTLPNPAVGGTGLDARQVVAATIKGDVLAYAHDGKKLWAVQLGSEIAAPPLLAGNLVLVRGSDGRLSALSAENGELKWSYTRQQPSLLLRNHAAPVVDNNVVFYGQAAGRLAALDLKDGRVLWESQVMQPRGASEIERVADVVAPPVIDSTQACAVAYQGRLACFNALNGNLIWSRDVSSWAGLALDGKNIYVSDDKGYVIGYERSGGRNLWRQDKLFMRNLGAPALIGQTLVAGDFEGYLHFIDIEDGSFVAQKATDNGAIIAAPLVRGERWLVQTQNGGLFLFGRK